MIWLSLYLIPKSRMKFHHFPRFLLCWRYPFYFHHQIYSFLGIVGALFLSLSFSCFLLIFEYFFQLERSIHCFSFLMSWNLFCIFCLYLLTIAFKSFQLSVQWLHLLCKIQYFLLRWRASIHSSLDSTTLESESFCFLFLILLRVFLAAAEDFFLSSLGSKFSTLISKKPVISLMVESA